MAFLWREGLRFIARTHYLPFHLVASFLVRSTLPTILKSRRLWKPKAFCIPDTICQQNLAWTDSKLLIDLIYVTYYESSTFITEILTFAYGAMLCVLCEWCYKIYACVPHYLSKNLKNSEFCNTAASRVLSKGLWSWSTTFLFFFFHASQTSDPFILIDDGTQPDGQACQDFSLLSLTKSKATWSHVKPWAPVLPPPRPEFKDWQHRLEAGWALRWWGPFPSPHTASLPGRRE